MSLRSRIVLIVTLAVAIYTLGDHMLQGALLLPRFAGIERREARNGIDRATDAIQAEIDYLDLACRDRASSNQLRNFVLRGETPELEEFVAANLKPDALVEHELDLLCIVDRQGQVRWRELRDWRTKREFTLKELPRGKLDPGHSWLVDTNEPRNLAMGVPNGYVSGLVPTEHDQSLLISVRPILPSDGQGEVLGTLILGRFLSPDLLEKLNEKLKKHSKVEIAAWPLDSPKMPQQERELLARVTPSAANPVSEERGSKLLDVYTTLLDLDQRASLLVRASVPRDISLQGAVAARYGLLSTLSAGLLMLLVLLTVLQRIVVSPLGRLTDHVVRIGQSEDTRAHIDLADGRQDEIGILAREFEGMLQKLARSRAAVVETARRSGMSEIANGILHNVGNVLNSVNVSAGVVAERVRSSGTPKLARLASLVQEHQDDLGAFITRDPRGRHLGPYLGELSSLMCFEHAQMLNEVDALGKGLDHIRQLVASHQAYAGRSGLREAVDLKTELESAVHITEQAGFESQALEIEWQLVGAPTLHLDRHRLLEVLVNLVKNAREALADGSAPRRLRFAIQCDEAAQRLALEISDSGPGIESENLTKIFQHGFTTKPGGHGFGLHFSANAARELGGSLTVRSPGELGGATFVVELPLESSAASVGGAA
jgi:two-component system, NtrC family, sensor kinase